MVRVIGAAAPVVLAPGDRVVGAHRAAGEGVDRRPVAGLVEGSVADCGQHVAEAANVGRPVVIGVVEVPVLGQVLARVVHAVRNLVRHRLGAELACGSGPEDVGQELPVGLGLDGRPDADEAAAGAEVGLECRLLCWVEGTAGRVEEHHGPEPGQVLGGETRRVAVGLDTKAVRHAELADCLNGGHSGEVGCAAGEDEDPVLLGGRRRRHR